MNFVLQSKTSNKIAKQTSGKPPRIRSEGRSKRESISTSVKSSKVSVTCSKISRWCYFQLLPQLSQHWRGSEVTARREEGPPAPSLAPDTLRFISHFASLLCRFGFCGLAQLLFVVLGLLLWTLTSSRTPPLWFFPFVLTLLITVIYCSHKIPNLKYWPIWSHPPIKKITRWC